MSLDNVRKSVFSDCGYPPVEEIDTPFYSFPASKVIAEYNPNCVYPPAYAGAGDQWEGCNCNKSIIEHFGHGYGCGCAYCRHPYSCRCRYCMRRFFETLLRILILLAVIYFIYNNFIRA